MIEQDTVCQSGDSSLKEQHARLGSLHRWKEVRETKNSVSVLDVLLGLFLLCALIYTAYLIFAKLNPYGLHADLVNEITYRQLCWEQKTFYPDGFVAGHESFISRPVLIYWLFYGLTGNFMLSYQLEAISTLLILLGTIYFLMGKLVVNRSVKLLSLCMFLVALPDDIKYVAFWTTNAYVLFFVAVLLTLALRNDLWERFYDIASLNQRKTWLPLLILPGIAAFFGFTTTKLALVLYIPLFCVDFLRLFSLFIHQRPVKQRDIFMMAVSTLTLLTNCVFYIVFIYFHGDTINPLPIVIADLEKWLCWENLSAQMLDILKVLGISGEGNLGSISGIRFLLSCCVVALELISVAWLIGKSGKYKENEKSNELVWYLISSTAIIALVDLVTGEIAFGCRYYFVTALLLPILCGMALNDWITRNSGKVLLWPSMVVGLGLLAIFGVTVKEDTAKYSVPSPELEQVATYIFDNGYAYVTASYEKAGVIKGYTNGAVEAQHSDSWGGMLTLNPFRWLIDVNKFEQEREGVPNILLLTDEEEQQIYQEQQDVVFLLQDYSQKVTEIGEYNLYALTENPYTLIKKVGVKHTAGLPLSEETEKTDFPSAEGFRYQNAVLNAQGELVSNGTEGQLLYGPYSQSIAGIYNITLHYIVDSGVDIEACGIFDIALDMQQYEKKEFTAAGHSVTLENVVIDDGRLFEARVWVPEGMIVRVQSIEYERVLR